MNLFPENVMHFEKGVGGQGDFRMEKVRNNN